MRIKDIPYDVNFYWKGDKYTQVIRPKKPAGKFNVVCRLIKEPFSKWVDMPSGRKVKPVIKVDINNSFP